MLAVAYFTIPVRRKGLSVCKVPAKQVKEDTSIKQSEIGHLPIAIQVANFGVTV